MTGDRPQTGPRHEPDRIYQRAADPAAAAKGLCREPAERYEADRASGTTASGQGAER